MEKIGVSICKVKHGMWGEVRKRMLDLEQENARKTLENGGMKGEEERRKTVRIEKFKSLDKRLEEAVWH